MGSVSVSTGTAPKEDLQASSAELVYDQPLRVPGELVPGSTVPWSASVQRATLLDKGSKHFVVDMGGKQERISVDRLKPAHLDVSTPVQLANTPRHGRPPAAPPILSPHSCHNRTQSSPPVIPAPGSTVRRSRSGRVVRPPRR
ncbi:hypothetical protein QQF64_004553 [Cirrhinus molitorella]|uniref:Uncharacterized protein n=1 Tax=Cirrhinus molitorella TaxID=172907 RepID=A0ABR3MK24_9TELE